MNGKRNCTLNIDSNEKRFNSNYFETLEAVATFDMDQKEISRTQTNQLAD